MTQTVSPVRSGPLRGDETPDAPASPARTQAERRAASERKLLLAAAELIAEGGVAAATFERIGERAGYSRGLVSQRFGSKDGLIAALVKELTAAFDARLAAEHFDELPPHEALVAFVDVYFGSLWQAPVENLYHVLLAESLASQPALRPIFAGVHEAVGQRLRGLIERAQAAGTMPADLDADAAALSVGGFLLGMTIQTMVDPQTDIERVRRHAVSSMRVALRIG